MNSKTDEIKGRIKEVAGTLTGNEKLRQEGKTEQTISKIEQGVENIAEKVKATIHKAAE
jgi:uncharacterized protein YjbJ (UPF0337 family)